MWITEAMGFSCSLSKVTQHPLGVKAPPQQSPRPTFSVSHERLTTPAAFTTLGLPSTSSKLQEFYRKNIPCPFAAKRTISFWETT